MSRGTVGPWAREDGSTLPLIFGFFAVALALVFVATAATSLYVERSRLYTLADGAALAAAQSLALGIAAAAGDGGVPPPDGVRATAAASEYLAAATGGRRDAVVLVAAGAPDGRSARVRLATTWRPPIVSAFVPRGVRIEVYGSARSVFW
ncbi:pilus assembly protein TadG-related protein [Gryllotalpicola reticulitermitis]|uniref:Pilus assembly protein TadG-related protein n=1 Tax=Gryllotalpicola reticulitermitis TaxID=1184153 RepID=A0ABV8Q9E0_9MICO